MTQSNAPAEHQILPHISVSSLRAGSALSGFYILGSAVLKTASSGKPFLNAAISDSTGSIPVFLWNYAGPIGPGEDGRIVFVKGQASEFKGNLQVTLESLRLAEESDGVDLDALVPVAPIDCDQMLSEIRRILASMEDEDYRAVCEAFLQRHLEAFLSIPAAKTVHHSFLHGLLMHTGYMVKIADELSGMYASFVNRSLLLAGTFLHDFAKREEFTFSELGLVSGYSVRGQLLGHLVMGAQEVCELAKELGIPEEKSVLLQHLLLSHHGKPEYGAAVVPVCAESELLSMIDMLDARMEIYRETLAETPLGEFSGRIFSLDGNRVYHHYDPVQSE